ncbi:restriction endonuclease subunit S [Ruegeria sp. R13_0]|uniref:restriction endonuclease subunit S n=1 Tax=Ruegeria sp. R13_0 TaxID=2821099 RepID=UPI001ADC6BFD|nr:restriction endonuclease subunit S [Ruegeria sp. R13_0]
MVSGKYWVNNHAHILRGNAAIENAFLCHQLNVVDYRGRVSGTTRLKLTQASMKELPIRIAPLPALSGDSGHRYDVILTNPPFGKKSS